MQRDDCRIPPKWGHRPGAPCEETESNDTPEVRDAGLHRIQHQFCRTPQ